MADEAELHPLVQLMLARIESHPQEFEYISQRWTAALDATETYAKEEERKLIREAIAKVRLDEAHREAMDELLNGDEQRRKVEEEAEYEKRLIAQQRQKLAMQQYSGQSWVGIGGAPAEASGRLTVTGD
jgi:hypothetical protein